MIKLQTKSTSKWQTQIEIRQSFDITIMAVNKQFEAYDVRSMPRSELYKFCGKKAQRAQIFLEDFKKMRVEDPKTYQDPGYRTVEEMIRRTLMENGDYVLAYARAEAEHYTACIIAQLLYQYASPEEGKMRYGEVSAEEGLKTVELEISANKHASAFHLLKDVAEMYHAIGNMREELKTLQKAEEEYKLAQSEPIDSDINLMPLPRDEELPLLKMEHEALISIAYSIIGSKRGNAHE